MNGPHLLSKGKVSCRLGMNIRAGADLGSLANKQVAFNIPTPRSAYKRSFHRRAEECMSDIDKAGVRLPLLPTMLSSSLRSQPLTA